MTADLSQFYQVFFDETAEHLANMEKLLLGLNVSRPDMDNLNAIFRSAHSIKGGAGTFGFEDMGEVTHILETLLDRLRKQEMTLTPEMVNVFLEAGDAIAMQLAAHRGQGDVDYDAVSNVCQKLTQLSTMPGSELQGGADSGEESGFFESSASSDTGGNSDDEDSGFFDDQPGAPAPEQAAPKESAPAPVESNKLAGRVGAKIEIHGQGFGFFDDEPAPPVKPSPIFTPTPERQIVEPSPRKDSAAGKAVPKPGSGAERASSSGVADSDFGFFDDQPNPPASAQNAQKPPSLSSDAEDADQKAKRDFHGKGYGFF